MPLLKEENEWRPYRPREDNSGKIKTPSIVGEAWQRIVGDKWVVGVTVENLTDRYWIYIQAGQNQEFKVSLVQLKVSLKFRQLK